jgi:hypothetical protein
MASPHDPSIEREIVRDPNKLALHSEEDGLVSGEHKLVTGDCDKNDDPDILVHLPEGKRSRGDKRKRAVPSQDWQHGDVREDKIKIGTFVIVRSGNDRLMAR